MDGITLLMTPIPNPSLITANGNFSLLYERLLNESDPKTLPLLQHLLAYIKSRHSPVKSTYGRSDAQYAEVRIKSGAAQHNVRTVPALQPTPLECEIVLIVRQPGQYVIPPVEEREGLGDAESEGGYLGLEALNIEAKKQGTFQEIDRWISSTPVLFAERDLPNPRAMAPPAITPAQRQNVLAARQIHLPSIQLALKDLYEQELNQQHRLPPIRIPEEKDENFFYEEESSRSSVIATTNYGRVRSIRSYGWSSRSSSSRGQNSNPGSHWEGAFSMTTNSGFASGIHHSGKRKAPKEGYESRKRLGTVGRIGNEGIVVTAGLADAARGIVPSSRGSSLFGDPGLFNQERGYTTPPLWTISEQEETIFAGPETAESQKRSFCKYCYDFKDGFSNPDELEEHIEAAHSSLVKKYVCVAPPDIKPEYTPSTPLSACEACTQGRKRYGAHWNAAAHLRRAHFISPMREKEPGDWPPMDELRRWMADVMWPVNEEEEEEDSQHQSERPDMKAKPFPKLRVMNRFDSD